MSVPNPTTPTTPSAPTIQWTWFDIWSYIENKGALGMDALQKLRKEITISLFGFWVFVQVAYVIVANKPTTIVFVAPIFLLMAGFLLYHIWSPQLLKWELGIAALTAANDPATVQQTIPGAIRSLQVVFAFGAITYMLWIPLAFLIVVVAPVKVAHPEYDLGIAYLVPTMMVFAGMGSLAANIEGKFTLHLGIALGLGIILAISTMLVAPDFPVWIPFVLATGGLLAVFEKGAWKFFVWLFSKKGAFLAIAILIAWYLLWPASFKEHQKKSIEEHQSAGTFLGDITRVGGKKEESQTEPKTADDAAKRAEEGRRANTVDIPFKKVDLDGCEEIGSGFPIKPKFKKPVEKKNLAPGDYAITTEGSTDQRGEGMARSFRSDGSIMDLDGHKAWITYSDNIPIPDGPYGIVTIQIGRGAIQELGTGKRFRLTKSQAVVRLDLNMFQTEEFYEKTFVHPWNENNFILGHFYRCNQK